MSNEALEQAFKDATSVGELGDAKTTEATQAEIVELTQKSLAVVLGKVSGQLADKSFEPIAYLVAVRGAESGLLYSAGRPSDINSLIDGMLLNSALATLKGEKLTFPERADALLRLQLVCASGALPCETIADAIWNAAQQSKHFAVKSRDEAHDYVHMARAITLTNGLGAGTIEGGVEFGQLPGEQPLSDEGAGVAVNAADEAPERDTRVDSSADGKKSARVLH